jgi:uncharacterized membrane protein YadS
MVGRAVPWFVIGFVAFAGLRTAGLLDGTLPTGGTLADLSSLLASVLILIALAGVGMAADVRTLAGVGARPFLLAAGVWLVIGALALVAATAVAVATG